MLKQLVFLLLVFLCIDLFKVYIILLLILNRGLIVQNQLWWKLCDLILPTHRLDQIFDKYRHGTHYINIIVNKFRVVNNIDEINTILYNSPIRYRTGFLKLNFFKNLMPNNVGVIAQDHNHTVIKWQEMRKFNEQILETNMTHSQLITHYKDQIINICNNSEIPLSREYFINIADQIVKLLLFGHMNVSNIILPGSKLYDLPNIFNLLSAPDHTQIVSRCRWKKIIKNTQIKPISLLGQIKDLDDQQLEVYDQIPHWIFPIYGVITSALIRALLLDQNYNKKNIPTRNILLETFRLYSPVTTLFRKDMETDEEILILLQMILRDKRYFENPHSFYPERFNDKKLEYKTYSLMFAHGPQVCPGKNFILYLCEILFDTIKPHFYSDVKLDCDDLPDSLNPFELF